MEELEERQLRAAATQSLFREVNEQIEGVQRAFGDSDEADEYVCECLEPTCTQRFSLARKDYERVRGVPNRFVVLAGHVDLEVERIVEAHDGYVLVDKLGVGGTLAARMDPRNLPG